MKKRLFLNDPNNVQHGRELEILEHNPHKPNPYRVRLIGGTYDWWETESALSVTPLTQPAPLAWEPLDISSGLGIGGTGSDDYNISTEADVDYNVRGTCKWGGTRYDEACEICGQITAVCNDCERCENCHEK
jgi:hypothetical protein